MSTRPSELAAELRAAGVLLVEVDASDNRMQNKIRLAQEQKVPVHAGPGRPRGRGAHRVGPPARREKDAPQETLAWADLAEQLGDEVRERRVVLTSRPTGGYERVVMLPIASIPANIAAASSWAVAASAEGAPLA